MSRKVNSITKSKKASKTSRNDLTVEATTKIATIKDVLARVDVEKVESMYTTELLMDRDEGFVDYLSFYLDDRELDKWYTSPNSHETLEELARIGFNYYNTVILGN